VVEYTRGVGICEKNISSLQWIKCCNVFWDRWAVTYRNGLYSNSRTVQYKWLTVIVHNIIQFLGVDSKCCQSRFRVLAAVLMWKFSAGRVKR